MTYPTISLCIPTFNEEKNIERCLNSIMSKKYPGKLDILIVDGGSTDDTLIKAKKFPVRVLHNPDKQAEIGKKIGLLNAAGDYFMIIDCDMDLVGTHWFERLLKPLIDDSTIVGSWPIYKSIPSDTLLNKFITAHPLQLDPIFEFLTASYDSCIVAKTNRYDVLEYRNDRMLPSGFCLYRRKQLMQSSVMKLKRFMENDNVVLLLADGLNRYAVPYKISFHHPTLQSLRHLIKKRIRNINTMYFDQPDKRYWTWIDWNRKSELFKLVLWVFYCYTIIPSILVGLWKCIKHKSLLGIYELPVNLLTTTAVIVAFLQHKEGRKLLHIPIR